MQVQSPQPTCLKDHVNIYDITKDGDDKLLGRICVAKSLQLQNTYYSSWEKMKVVMDADKEFSGAGFLAKYESKTFDLPQNLWNDVVFNGE